VRPGVDDHGRLRTEPRCLRELALLGAAGVVGVTGKAARAQCRHRRDHLRTVSALVDDEEAVDLVARQLALADREEQSLDAGAEADAGRRRPPDRLDEPVVATAAADDALRADGSVLELERGARVVVEPADESRCEVVLDAECVQVFPDAREVVAARVAQRVADLGRIREDGVDALGLDVEDSQR
jgi:hypothetical protein